MSLSSKPPTLSDNDPLYQYAEYTRKMAELVNGPWMDCTEIYPYKFQSGKPCQVRREGMRWYASWGFSSAGMAAGGSYLVGKLPDGAAPSDYRYFQIGSSNPGASALCVIRSNGDIEIRTGTVLGNYYILDAVHWPAR